MYSREDEGGIYFKMPAMVLLWFLCMPRPVDVTGVDIYPRQSPVSQKQERPGPTGESTNWLTRSFVVNRKRSYATGGIQIGTPVELQPGSGRLNPACATGAGASGAHGRPRPDDRQQYQRHWWSVACLYGSSVSATASAAGVGAGSIDQPVVLAAVNWQDSVHG